MSAKCIVWWTLSLSTRFELIDFVFCFICLRLCTYQTLTYIGHNSQQVSRQHISPPKLSETKQHSLSYLSERKHGFERISTEDESKECRCEVEAKRNMLCGVISLTQSEIMSGDATVQWAASLEALKSAFQEHKVIMLFCQQFIKILHALMSVEITERMGDIESLFCSKWLVLWSLYRHNINEPLRNKWICTVQYTRIT